MATRVKGQRHPIQAGVETAIGSFGTLVAIWFATGACITPLRSPGEFPPYAGNMLWRPVAVLPLADRQLQPYINSVTIAAPIDRAGVRPLLSAHKTAL